MVFQHQSETAFIQARYFFVVQYKEIIRKIAIIGIVFLAD